MKITTRARAFDDYYLGKALNQTDTAVPNIWSESESLVFSLKDCTMNRTLMDDLVIKGPDTSKFYTDDMLDYLLKEVIDKKAKEAEKELDKMAAEKNRKKIDAFIDAIDKVYFNNPATVIKWKDGTKTVVKCQKGDTYDAEKGFAMALIKGLFYNSSYFNTIFEKWLPKED